MPLDLIRDPRVISRFLALVRKEGDAWLWLGAKDRKGYGRFRYQGHVLGAHRVSYAIFNGPIAEGLYVHHSESAVGPSDCNPCHLILVDLVENTRLSNVRRSRSIDDIPI